MEIGNLPNKEYKAMIIKMMKELGKRLDEQNEKLDFYNKGNINMNQTEMRNTITKMQNTLEGINSRLNDTEEWINELEDRLYKYILEKKTGEFSGGPVVRTLCFHCQGLGFDP